MSEMIHCGMLYNYQTFRQTSKNDIQIWSFNNIQQFDDTMLFCLTKIIQN